MLRFHADPRRDKVEDLGQRAFSGWNVVAYVSTASRICLAKSPNGSVS